MSTRSTLLAMLSSENTGQGSPQPAPPHPALPCLAPLQVPFLCLPAGQGLGPPSLSPHRAGSGSLLCSFAEWPSRLPLGPPRNLMVIRREKEGQAGQG